MIKSECVPFRNFSLCSIAFGIAILGVPFSGGSLSLMYYYPVILLVICLSVLHLLRWKSHMQIEHLCISVLLLISVWHMGTSIDNFETSKTLISILLFFIMFFLLVMYTPKLYEIKFIAKCFAVSGVIIALLLFILKEEYGLGRYSYPIMGRLLEVNYLACYLSITFLFNFHTMLISKNTKKVFYGIFSFMILLAMFLTGSRGAFLAVSISSIILLLYHPAKIIWKILLVFCLFALGFLFLPEDLTSRFLKDSYNDGSNQMRLYLFHNALNYILEKPVLGYGVSSGKAITGFGSAHNTFLSVLLNFGLIGLIMYFVIMFRNFKIFLQKDMLLFLAVFVDLFITSMIITNYNTIPFWFTMIFFIWVRDFKKKNPNISLWREI